MFWYKSASVAALHGKTWTLEAKWQQSPSLSHKPWSYAWGCWCGELTQGERCADTWQWACCWCRHQMSSGLLEAHHHGVDISEMLPWGRYLWDVFVNMQESLTGFLVPGKSMMPSLSPSFEVQHSNVVCSCPEVSWAKDINLGCKGPSAGGSWLGSCAE